MHSFLYYYLIFINCTAFVVYGADKAFAKLHSWRVPEIVLLVLAALGGSAGAFIAMQLFRHKTQHLKFIFGVPLIFFLQVALAERSLKTVQTVQNHTTPCCIRLWGCTVFVLHL